MKRRLWMLAAVVGLLAGFAIGAPSGSVPSALAVNGEWDFYDGIKVCTIAPPTGCSSVVVTDAGLASYAQKIVWSTPDPIQNDNNGGTNTRILVGPLKGIAGTISSVNCQPQERGDGGGRLYVTLAEVTDGGYTALCAMDFDSCDLADITANQLGLLTLSRGGCSQSLSASSTYMYSFGQPLDGGPRCGLNTPILNCTTVINPP